MTGTATLDSGTQVFSVVSPEWGKRMLVRSCRGGGSDGWYLSQVLSRQQFNQQRVVYLLLIVGISAAIISLGCLLTILLNKIISQPIRRLSLKIDAIADGDFSRDSEIEWNHELGSIGRGINNMSENIVTLMDKRVADENRKRSGIPDSAKPDQSAFPLQYAEFHQMDGHDPECHRHRRHDDGSRQAVKNAPREPHPWSHCGKS